MGPLTQKDEDEEYGHAVGRLLLCGCYGGGDVFRLSAGIGTGCQASEKGKLVELKLSFFPLTYLTTGGLGDVTLGGWVVGLEAAETGALVVLGSIEGTVGFTGGSGGFVVEDAGA